MSKESSLRFSVACSMRSVNWGAARKTGRDGTGRTTSGKNGERLKGSPTTSRNELLHWFLKQ